MSAVYSSPAPLSKRPQPLATRNVNKYKQQIQRLQNDLKQLQQVVVNSTTVFQNQVMSPTMGTWINSTNSIATITTAPTSSTMWVNLPGTYTNIAQIAAQPTGGDIKIDHGTEARIELPDGAVIEVNADGSYKLIDKDAKITYAANRSRAFNPYVNSSDMLEEFISFCGDVGGISKQTFLDLPIELFIRWLVIRAAEADGEDGISYEDVRNHPALAPKALLALPAPQKRHCKHCGRFLSSSFIKADVHFCSAEHFDAYLDKVAA